MRRLHIGRCAGRWWLVLLDVVTGGRRAGGGMVCAALLLAACGGGAADVPTATVPAAPATTTTVDPYAVPAVIDAAYVNRVLAGLDAANGEILRTVMREKVISQEVGNRLSALYMDDDRRQLALDLLVQDLSYGFKGVKAEPGNDRTVVTKLISVRSDCVFAEVDRDQSEIVTEPDSSLRRLWVALVPATAGRDRGGYNLTRWGYRYEGFQRDLSAPEDPCGSL